MTDRLLKQQDLEQLEAALAEAERWKAKYEALWAGMERAEAHFAKRADDEWKAWECYDTPSALYKAKVWEQARDTVRDVLSEAGGGGVSEWGGLAREYEQLKAELAAAKQALDCLRAAAQDVVRLEDEHIDPGMAGPYAVASLQQQRREAIERLRKALETAGAGGVSHAQVFHP